MPTIINWKCLKALLLDCRIISLNMKCCYTTIITTAKQRAFIVENVFQNKRDLGFKDFDSWLPKSYLKFIRKCLAHDHAIHSFFSLRQFQLFKWSSKVDCSYCLHLQIQDKNNKTLSYACHVGYDRAQQRLIHKRKCL